MTLSRRLPNRGFRFADHLPAPIGRALDSALDRLEKVSQGLPQLHASTHLQGGSDPLRTPTTPSTLVLNEPSSKGTGTAYALEDHEHRIDLLLSTRGDLVGFDGTDYVVIDQSGAADGDVLTRDSGEPAHAKWSSPGASSSEEAIFYGSFMGRM